LANYFYFSIFNIFFLGGIKYQTPICINYLLLHIKKMFGGR